MASDKVLKVRVQALVAEIIAEEQESVPQTIDEIENAMVRIGDMVAREFNVSRK